MASTTLGHLLLLLPPAGSPAGVRRSDGPHRPVESARAPGVGRAAGGTSAPRARHLRAAAAHGRHRPRAHRLAAPNRFSGAAARPRGRVVAGDRLQTDRGARPVAPRRAPPRRRRTAAALSAQKVLLGGGTPKYCGDRRAEQVAWRAPAGQVKQAVAARGTGRAPPSLGQI